MDRGALSRASVRVSRTLTILQPPERVYQFWRRLEQLPDIVPSLLTVRQTDAGRSHWVARGPEGSRIEWDGRMTYDVPARLLAWETLPGADVPHAGSVELTPALGNRATLVTVTLRYAPPAGPASARLAGLLGADPAGLVAESLRRLKQLMEAGESVPRRAGIPEKRQRMVPADEAPMAPEGLAENVDAG